MNPFEILLICPVCDTETNSSGQPFVSDWAVACHIAGSAKTGNLSHQHWIRKVLGDVDFSQSIPRLAGNLEFEVHKEMRELREKRRIKLETPASVALEIEGKLHSYIKQRLVEYFGEIRSAWWVKGVPQNTRIECATRLEQATYEDRLEESYQYTHLINLKEIMDKKWEIFEPFASKVTLGDQSLSKKVFMDWLQKTNVIRNRYAHVDPPKEGSQKYRDDLETTMTMKRIIDTLCEIS
jgi:hypothetical protein